jgi:hypothetical protein
MSGIAVYMEGGGRDSKQGKASIRQGMAEFIRSRFSLMPRTTGWPDGTRVTALWRSRTPRSSCRWR